MRVDRLSDMDANDKALIPADLAPYLNEIAERLWSNHAAVMVGAGFSKNARKTVATAPNFPSWYELGNSLHEKLHNRPPDVGTHYLNPLKLADEVQAALGRPALDQLLRSRIPDNEYEPSELHVRLLELPWIDVFTVNYDTLLERASTKVASRRFDVVVAKEDLVYSSRPRIVKLHGSFPSHRPFIISEEDYRCYPRDHAPFVNTVQQALLENTLCLFGFSGDDPNFLHWIGWVRDNLGKQGAPKIYLVGILDLTAAQKKLLEDRNVVPVDLGLVPGIGNDHQKALALFFDGLRERRPAAPYEWSPRLPLGQPPSLPDLLERWATIRKAYPNWIVAPEAARESLLQDLNSLEPLLVQSAAADGTTDIEFLYEMNWRLERALCPIPGNFIHHYERVIGRYNPSAQMDSKPGHSQTVNQFWIDLSLALLRTFREDSLSEKWNSIRRLIEAAKSLLSPEQTARFSYEKCLQALFGFDFDRIREELAAWPINPALPFWEVKRAGLLAELGDVDEAGTILEKSLAAIRANQQLTPVVSDLTWVSQESYAMYLLGVVSMARRLPEYKLTSENRERWHELKKYLCDPWADLERFEVELKTSASKRILVTRKKDFDIDREIVTRHLGSGDRSTLIGYTFLRYCEEAGLPFVVAADLSMNVAVTQAGYAAERIAEASSSWALVTLLRTGKSEVGELLFDRSALAQMSVLMVDSHIDHFLGVLRTSKPLIAQGNRFSNANIGIRIAWVVPEMLSRLSVRCSASRRGQLLDLLKELYHSPFRLNYDGVKNFAIRLFGSLPKSEQCARIREWLRFPLLGDSHPLEQMGYPEPFLLLSLKKQDVQRCELPHISVPDFEFLIAGLATPNGEARSRAGLRLGRLFEWGLLTSDQAAAFGESLWANVGPDGFPRIQFLKSAFLKLPRPERVDPVKLFKSYILGVSPANFDAQAGGAMQISVTGKPTVNIVHGDIPWCQEILNGSKGLGAIEWSAQEAVMLLIGIIGWWNAGKDHLREPAAQSAFSGIAGEFRARYTLLVRIVAEVVAPRLSKDLDPENKTKLKRLLDELDEYRICSTPARAASLHIFPAREFQILSGINSAIIQDAVEQVVPTLEAIQILVGSDSANREALAPVLVGGVGQQIKWRREHWLVSAMHVLTNLVFDWPDRLPPEIIADALLGLDNLCRESDPRFPQPSIDVPTQLSWRKAAARLAYRLFERYENTEVEIPPSLLAWREICSNPEEFADVRNEWG